jgi:hypothetical protein
MELPDGMAGLGDTFKPGIEVGNYQVDDGNGGRR